MLWLQGCQQSPYSDYIWGHRDVGILMWRSVITFQRSKWWVWCSVMHTVIWVDCWKRAHCCQQVQYSLASPKKPDCEALRHIKEQLHMHQTNPFLLILSSAAIEGKWMRNGLIFDIFNGQLPWGWNVKAMSCTIYRRLHNRGMSLCKIEDG